MTVKMKLRWHALLLVAPLSTRSCASKRPLYTVHPEHKIKAESRSAFIKIENKF